MGPEVIAALGVLAQAATQLDWSSVIAFVLGGERVFQMLFNRQYDKARDEAFKVGMTLVATHMDDKERRDKLIEAAWNVIPKQAQTFMSDKQMSELVDIVWVSQVRPEAKRQGILPADVPKTDGGAG